MRSMVCVTEHIFVYMDFLPFYLPPIKGQRSLVYGHWSYGTALTGVICFPLV